MGSYFDRTMRMGHYYNSRVLSIRLFHHCQSIANIHEAYFTFRYQVCEYFLFIIYFFDDSILLIKQYHYLSLSVCQKGLS